MTRPLRLGLLATGFIVFVTVMYLSFGGKSAPAFQPATSSEPFGGSIGSLGLSETLLTGGAIAPKLENATAK